MQIAVSLALLSLELFLVLMVKAQDPPRTRRLPITMVNSARRKTERSSEPIVIRIASPGSRPTGRRVPNLPNLPPEASIVRLKPVIRFHVPIQNDTSIGTSNNHVDLYQTFDQMGLHRMAELLRKAELEPELMKIGAITIFAPTDDAFSMSPRGLLEGFQTDPDVSKLREFLLYHVIRGHMFPRDVRNDFTMPTIHSSAAAQRFNIYNDGQVVSVSGAQFLGSAHRVGDALIQPVDRIIFPMPQQDIVQKTRDQFSQLQALINRCGLSDQLASGTFTLFAPINEAFAALPAKAKELLMSNTTLLRKFLLNHVVPGTYFSTALVNKYSLKPLGSESLSFTTRRGLILVNGVPIVKPDLPATNGVVHAINRVLVSEELSELCRCMPRYPLAPATLKPISDMTSTPSSRDETDENFTEEPHSQQPLVELLNRPMQLPDGRTVTFNTAVQLFRKSLLFNKLRNPGNKRYTVLLPTDGAFQKLPSPLMDTFQQDPRRLTEVLRWHVVEGNVDPTTLKDNTRLKTLAGGTLLVNVLPRAKNRLLPPILIGGVPVLATRRATNGGVFAVDSVFSPPPEDKDVSQSLTEDERDQLSIWKQIINDLPDLKARLKSKQEVYTMFAPTNAAFAQLSPDHLRRLLSEESLKRDIVRSHVLSGAYFRSMLSTGMVVPTLLGNNVHFTLTPDGFLANDVPVNKPGVITRNGVIYVVNKLLLNPDTNNVRMLAPPVDQDTGDADDSKKSFDQILEDIAARNNATTFLKWIHVSGMQNIIRAQAHCTLFMPSNEAIAVMSPTLRLATLGNVKVLRRLVKYHICSVPITSLDDITQQDRMLPSLLPKKDIRCNTYLNKTVVTASGCPVSKVVPVSDTNVSVVVIKRPLSPPVGNIFLTALKSPMLRNFTKILRVAEMDSFFENEDGPFTFFAPSKCAFSQMSPQEYEKLITDKQAARDFVLRHVVRGCYYTSGMTDSTSLITMAGTVLNMKTTHTDCILVNGVKLKFGDLSATNGVIHIVADIL